MNLYISVEIFRNQVTFLSVGQDFSKSSHIFMGLTKVESDNLSEPWRISIIPFPSSSLRQIFSVYSEIFRSENLVSDYKNLI